MAAGESLLMKDISLRHPFITVPEVSHHHHPHNLKLPTPALPSTIPNADTTPHSHVKQEAASHEEALEHGVNDNGDCFCEPWWFCCFNRCIKPRNAVSAVGFFDGIVNLFLCGITIFFILQWELHIRYIQNRGFLDEKRRNFGRFMEPNEDGMIILATSYGLMIPVSWNLSHHVEKNRRWDGVLWMLMSIYVTSLQVVALVFFPFSYNIFINVPWILIRVYEFWIVFRMDRLKRRIINRLHVPLNPHRR